MNDVSSLRWRLAPMSLNGLVWTAVRCLQQRPEQTARLNRGVYNGKRSTVTANSKVTHLDEEGFLLVFHSSGLEWTMTFYLHNRAESSTISVCIWTRLIMFWKTNWLASESSSSLQRKATVGELASEYRFPPWYRISIRLQLNKRTFWNYQRHSLQRIWRKSIWTFPRL